MKVLMINSVCGIRSTGRICTDLAAALEEQGCTVRIAYGRERVPAAFEKYAVRIGRPMGVRLHGLKARLLDASGFGSRFATMRFLDWVRDYDPDVIHLHNIHGYYLHIGLLFDYLRTCGKRIIWTLHDCWAFTGHAAYCEAADCHRWQTGCHDCPKRADYPKSLTDRSDRNWERKRKLFSGIPNLELAAPSQWLTELTGDSFLRAYPAHVIHNGIDTAVFHPVEEAGLRQRLGLGSEKVVLGVAALWEARKGFPDMLELADRLGPGYRVVLVGLSAEQLRALPNNVVGLTRTNSARELADLYAMADCYVNPTYEDNYPTTNLEAIACGTPVVTYRTGGSSEGAALWAGRTVEKGDRLALTEAVIRSCEKKPEQTFDPALLDGRQMVRQYLELYKSV